MRMSKMMLLGFLIFASFSLPFAKPNTTMAQDQAGTVEPNGKTPNTVLAGPLNAFRNVTLQGDYVAAGVGLRGATMGSIIISGIPTGATVPEAYLYWGFLDNGESPSLKSMNFNGSPITGALVGSGEDTCWGRSNSFAYRANVTSLVTGNGTYNLTGVASGGNILAQGASLVVLYQKTGDPTRTVILMDGDVVFNTFGASGSTIISGYTAAAPVSAKTTFNVGDGQSIGATESFTGGGGTATFTNPLDSSDGGLWDTDTFNVSSQVNAGDTSSTANINAGGDCLMWVAQAFSVTSGAGGCAIQCPPTQTVNTGPGATQCCAVVNYPAPTTTGTCGTVSCTPPAGTCFPVGTTTVTCTTTAGPSCSFLVVVVDDTPPVITCPQDIIAVGNPGDFCVPVNFTVTATDNCPGVTVKCVNNANPGQMIMSGFCFPTVPHCTTVKCTATDASANTAVCTFTVCVFDVCMEDDANPCKVLLFDSFTGDYIFCCCTFSLSGTGTVKKKGGTWSLTHTPPDRRVQVTLDIFQHRGSANLQFPVGTPVCSIQDRDTRNNSCQCS